MFVAGSAVYGADDPAKAIAALRAQAAAAIARVSTREPSGEGSGASPAPWPAPASWAPSVLGTTSPNPAVGAVILDADGTPVGEGATAAPGGPHAEVDRPRPGR